MESEKVKELKEFIKNSAELGCYYELANCEITMLEVIEYINKLEHENECKDIEICKKEYQIKKLIDRIAVLESIGLNEDITVGEYLQDMQRLKDKIAELEKEIEENAFYSKGYMQGIKNTYEVVIPEKLKQFAERLINKLKDKVDAENVDTFVECKKIIDETLKEFMNGNF